MSKTAIAFSGVILAATGAAFYLQHADNAILHQEIADLRTDLRQLAATNAAVAAQVRRDGPSNSASGEPQSVTAAAPRASDGGELTKLREEIVALRKSTTALTQLAETAQAAQALAKSSDSVATKLTPASDLKNAGKATPEASTETALWAAVGGDVDTLAQTLTFTPTARAKADAWFASLSESTQQQYGSPEKVIALMVARDAASLTGMQVLGQKAIGADDVGVRVRFAAGEGKIKDDTFLMHRSTDGWRMVLPDAAVEKFAKQVGGGK
jgi:hypothetical protein